MMKADTVGSKEGLYSALQDANLPSLLMVLVELTGDMGLLDRYPLTAGRGLDDNDTGGLTEESQSSLRRHAYNVLVDWEEGRLPKVARRSPDDLVLMYSRLVGEQVSNEYGRLVAEMLDDNQRQASVPIARGAGPGAPTAAIVGAGFSGLSAAIELKCAGFSFEVFEKCSSMGGTWYKNRYLGCRCDTPSHLYSYSFRSEAAEWSAYYAPQREIGAYIDRCAKCYAVTDHVNFGCEVVKAKWDDEAFKWNLTVKGPGEESRQVVVDVAIFAVGQFDVPSVPTIAGHDTFPGPAVHTAEWPKDLVLEGKNVAVVGTGASAMQVIPPASKEAQHLTVFQRTPQWVMPNANYHRTVSESTKYLLDQVPNYGVWYRARLFWVFGDRIRSALWIDQDWEDGGRSVSAANASVRRFLGRRIRDKLGNRPDLVYKCLPEYPPFGKRMLMDNGWYDTLLRDDVELVTEPIEEIRGDSIVTASSVVKGVDVLVYATGFRTLDFLCGIEVVGREGQTIHSVWGDQDARAYLGMTVPGFPNLFLMYGPNTNLAGGSVVFVSECQARYIRTLLVRMREDNLGMLECRPDVYEAYNREVDDAHSGLVWSHPSVRNYFHNGRRVVTNMPWSLVDYWSRTNHIELADYIVRSSPVRDPRGV